MSSPLAQIKKRRNPPPSVLFVCVGNACRSQMAEGFARHFAKDQWMVFSAGSQPAGFVSSKATEVMKEKGIDISRQFSKGLRDLPQKSFDVVVTMGCGDTCPFVSGKKQVDWKIPDPIGESEEFFRRVRDDIEEKVKKLLG